MKASMSGRDLLSSADSIQKGAQKKLGGKFETVVALDDFAYKSHFKVGSRDHFFEMTYICMFEEKT